MANPPTAGNAKKIGRGGRKRRVAGWTLLLLGLLVAAVWVWSVQIPVVLFERDGSAAKFVCGQFVFVGQQTDQPPGWMVAHRTSPRAMKQLAQSDSDAMTAFVELSDVQADYILAESLRRPKWKPVSLYRNALPTRTAFFYAVALWPIPLLLWTPAALLLRSGILARRRANTNACVKCGYSLAGLASDAPCPECGGGSA